MKNKKTNCKLCDKKHQSKTSKYCKDHRKIYEGFPSTRFFQYLFNHAKKAESLAVIPKDCDRLLGLASLVEKKHLSQVYIEGKITYSYDLSHLYPATPKDGWCGMLDPENLILVPSGLNRGKGNQWFSLKYGKKVKVDSLHSRHSLYGKNKKLISDKEIRVKLMNYLGERTISKLMLEKTRFTYTFRKTNNTKQQYINKTYNCDGVSPSEVIVSEVFRLSEYNEYFTELLKSCGHIYNSIDEFSGEFTTSTEVAKLVNAILEGVNPYNTKEKAVAYSVRDTLHYGHVTSPLCYDDMSNILIGAGAYRYDEFDYYKEGINTW